MRKKLALAATLALVAASAAGAAGPTYPIVASLAPDAIPIGNGYYLGGFSDLYPQSSLGREYWSITDRGPNIENTVDCVAGRDELAFPVEEFVPEILKLEAKPEAGALVVKRRIALHVGTTQASGLPVRSDTKNELAYGALGDCTTGLGTDVYGLDTEGIAVDRRDGSFWITDEYLPSVLHVAADGSIISRIVPQGLGYAAAGIAVEAEFPEIVGLKFRGNRGFEGLAISNDGTRLYTLLQSAMQNGSSTNASRAVRVFRLDISNPADVTVDREWVYMLQGTTDDRRISSLGWQGTKGKPDVLLVEERDNVTPSTGFTVLYRADFSAATNLLGGPYDVPAAAATSGGKTLEEWYKSPATGPVAPAAEVSPAAKSAWFDVKAALDAAGLSNGKIEGVAITPRGNESRVAVLNDNDFGVAGPLEEELDIFLRP